MGREELYLRSRGGAAWEEKMAAMEKELSGKREELEVRRDKDRGRDEDEIL